MTLQQGSASTPGVHYISLKPFSKKERKRQKAALAAEGVADMGGPVAVPEGGEEEDEEEEYVPRSPVPLPDADTCKPILVQLGFSSLSSAEKTKKKKGEQNISSYARVYHIKIFTNT